MEIQKKGRKLFSTNEFERKILGIVFVASSIPVILVVVFFYCVFFDLVYNQLRTSIAKDFLEQLLILIVILLAFYFLFVGILAYRFTHKLVGAFPRIMREMDERIQGKTKGHILIRKGDYMKTFIERINALIDKLP